MLTDSSVLEHPGLRIRITKPGSELHERRVEIMNRKESS
jgi:hypothetical protein